MSGQDGFVPTDIPAWQGPDFEELRARAARDLARRGFVDLVNDDGVCCRLVRDPSAPGGVRAVPERVERP